MGRCGCANTACTCVVTVADTATVDMTVSGNGSTARPYVISATATSPPDTTMVVGTGTPCISTSVVESPADTFTVSVTPILAADPNALDCTATGLQVKPSTDAGNTMIFGTDGRLFTPSSAVTLGCGVEFGGAGEIQANVSAWPFPCDQDANAPAIFCSPTDGHLQSGPLPHALTDQSGACAAGPGFGNVISSLNLNIVGDACRDETVMIVTEASLDVDSPGLLQANVELDINGAGFVVAGSGFLPGANNSGGTVRSVTSIFVHSLLTIPAGTTLTIGQRVRVTEATGAGTNTWIGGCVSSKATGGTL